MIDKETREELVNIARIEFSTRRVNEEQKSRLIQIHDSYLRLLPLKLIKADEIIRQCKDIEEASDKYLTAIKAPSFLPSMPSQLSLNEKRTFYITKAHVKASVEAYRNLAKECRLTYQGFVIRGRPRHWQKQIYITHMAAWYEDVKWKKPRSGTDSLFPRFLRACFYEIAPDDELSDSVIRSAMRYYHSPKRAELKRTIQEEKRRAIIGVRKKK
jgi:hypothetical protein